jgi:hypothetical protein
MATLTLPPKKQYENEGVRKYAEGRLDSLRQTRNSWWKHWSQIGQYMMPRRNVWLSINKTEAKGNPVNDKVINERAILAANVCATGIVAGTTSQGSVWFVPKIFNQEFDDNTEEKRWLDKVQALISLVLQESNYYEAKATQALDLCVYGTSPIIIEEDDEDIINCYVPTIGEFFCANNSRGKVGTLALEYAYTVAQVVKKFGIENVSESVKTLYKDASGAGQNTEIIVCMMIEEHDDTWVGKPIPKVFKWREVIWEKGTACDKVLSVRGFYEKPFSCTRWNLSGNDAYGSSPGMTALGAAKQIQHEEFSKGKSIDYARLPPMVADIAMKNQPASLIPGGMTYTATGVGSFGMKPAFEINPNVINLLSQDIALVESRIKEIFYNDLFMTVTNLDTTRTATEINARKQEQLIQLGPVLGRIQAELDDDLDRIFGIMQRKGLIPAPPESIQGKPIKMEYSSMLAEAQRASSVTAIEQLAAFAGNIAAVEPKVIKRPNWDELIKIYADALRVPSKGINSDDEVAAGIEAEAQQQQRQAMLEQSMMAIQGAKTLSETQVGGGQNAIERMLG